MRYSCQTLAVLYLPPLNESNRCTAGLYCIKVKVVLHQSEGCTASKWGLCAVVKRFVLQYSEGCIASKVRFCRAGVCPQSSEGTSWTVPAQVKELLAEQKLCTIRVLEDAIAACPRVLMLQASTQVAAVEQ